MAVRSLHTEFIELARSLGADDGYAIRIGPSVVYLDPRIGSKGSLLGAQLRISVSTPIAPYEILLRPEGAIDRAGKGMGINRELLTGDPVFDHAVYIETDGQDDDVKRILSEPRVREAVRELVAESFGIAMGGESFVEGSTSVRAASCLRVGFGTKAFADVDALRRVIGILVRLAQDMDRIALGGPYRGWRGEVAVAPARKARFGRGLFFVAWCIAVNAMGWYAVGFGATPPTRRIVSAGSSNDHDVDPARELFFEVSPDPILVFRQGKVTQANPAAIDLLRAPSQSALVGKTSSELIDPSSHATVEANVRAIESGARFTRSEEKYLRFDGTVVEVEVTAARATFYEGRSFVVILRDMTDRREVALRREREQEALRLSDAARTREKWLRETFDGLPIAVFAYDDDGRFLLVNRACSSLVGREPSELLGRTAEEAGCAHLPCFARGPEDPRLLEAGVRLSSPSSRSRTQRGRGASCS